ncbi:MAG: aldose 1-epimerase family protein [Chitinophagales bacterium]|nr:aldose 1-epimerase family protein [Chitinophagales bacterium]MDW8418714.1 aldose 1-epimerase family protein [Chitinophagales bacterium]
MHQIENEHLRVKARNYGAELISIFHKKTGTEHLWQADKNFWGWHAPILFPIVGRTLHDQLRINGKLYPMEKHGFARKSDFTLLELSGQKMVFVLRANAETLRLYPYRFELLCAYSLRENTLIQSMEVINAGNETMYFQIGGHPAFAVPFSSGEHYSDYYLEFEKTEHVERHYINAEGYFDGRKEWVLHNAATLPLLPHMFADDAIIFKDLKSRSVCIRCRHHSRYLRVDFHDFHYLGLWAKVNAPYVCIEPWLGCASAINDDGELSNKEGVMQLPAGERFNCKFTVSVFA